MPFRTEHSARQKDPGRYKKFRAGKPSGFPAGVYVLYGLRRVGGKTVSEIQTIRFKISQWTADRARRWLKNHGFKSRLEVAKPIKKMFAGNWAVVEKEENFWDGAI